MPSMCRTVVVMKRTLLALATVVAMGCVGLTACGDGDRADSDSSTSNVANSDATWNDADVKFVQGMIPHHEQAVEMSDMMVGRTVSEATAVLAEQIRTAQTTEVSLMQGFLAEWGVKLDPHAGHSGDHSMGEGMMSDEQLDELMSTDGVDFERMWLTMMLEHHKGAIAMASAVMADGAEPRVRALAEAIITAQEAEIAQIEAQLASLGG
jgi:uncharacterized protein (DUF305 family)